MFRPKRLKNHTRWSGTCLYSLYNRVPTSPGLEQRALEVHLDHTDLKFFCVGILKQLKNLLRIRKAEDLVKLKISGRVEQGKCQQEKQDNVACRFINLASQRVSNRKFVYGPSYYPNCKTGTRSYCNRLSGLKQ